MAPAVFRSSSTPSRRRAVVIASLTSVGVVALLLTPLPRIGRVSEAGLNLLHAPVFAGLTILLLRVVVQPEFRSRRVRTIAVAFLLLLLGVATEYGQTFVGRNTDWRDVLANALGIAAGLAWFLLLDSNSAPRRAAGYAIASVLLLLASWQPVGVLFDHVAQRREIPVIASFESARELSRWAGYDADITRVQLHATHGDWSLRVDLHADEYPGAALRWPVPDWSDHECLSLDLVLEEGPPLDVIVKIEDEAHSGEYEDRFHQVVHLMPGTSHVEVVLSNVAKAPATRMLDLRRISLLQLFVVRPGRKRTFMVDNIRLKSCAANPIDR